MVTAKSSELARLGELRRDGLRVAIDDFGTEYSSLGLLQRMTFDTIKIDRSFVQNLEEDEGARAIVGTIIELSRQLNCKIVAEGVETESQFAILYDLHCERIQGWLLGKPMAPAVIYRPVFQRSHRLAKDFRRPDKLRVWSVLSDPEPRSPMIPVFTPDATASLPDWLAYLESIHAKSIDLGLERVSEVAARLGLKLPMVKIVVGGTNGKGSTCAMLEAILLSAGYKVGLYTSPHLIDFNERARVNGSVASDGQLTEHFARVQQVRGETTLTYFEFTTLAVLSLFDASGLDVVVLEVGLGGRLDAVNIVDADCSIVTSVDIDHTDWLGSTRELIGAEKAHIFRAGKPAICSDPQPPESLLAYAADIGSDLWLFGKDFNYSGDRQQWAFGGRSQRRNALAYPALRGANQLLNASAALAALEALRERMPVPQQAVRIGLSQAALPGRFQILPGQPTVILDVAHNPHAAAVLSQNLDNMGFHPYTYAVFGMLSDKDIAGVVARFGEKIDHWFCCDLLGPRGLTGAALAEQVQATLGRSLASDDTPLCSHYADPARAYAQARERAHDNDRILVFGSFLTVASVLQALGRKA